MGDCCPQQPALAGPAVPSCHSGLYQPRAQVCSALTQAGLFSVRVCLALRDSCWVLPAGEYLQLFGGFMAKKKKKKCGCDCAQEAPGLPLGSQEGLSAVSI